MLKKILKQNSGFSLMELIVTLAIVSVLSVGLMSILSTTQRATNSIDKSMSCQQQAESVISIIRANLANATELSVIDTPSEMSAHKGDLMTKTFDDGSTVDYVDDYSYIIADTTNGGIILCDFDEEGNRTRQNIGGVKSLDMYDSACVDVLFSLTEAHYIDVAVTSSIIHKDRDADTETKTTTPYSLSTKIATDKNVCETGAVNASNRGCIRFRRVEVSNYSWEALPGGDGDDHTLEVGKKEVFISGPNMSTKTGAICIINTTNEMYNWPATTITFGGKLVDSFNCSDANYFINIDKKSVVVSPKSPVGRSDDVYGITFTFEVSEEEGVSDISDPVDNGDGTGYFTVINTNNETFTWNTSVTFSRPLEEFTVTPGDSQTILTSDFAVGNTTVHITGQTEKGEGPVQMNFTYVKRETDDNYIARFVVVNTETGTYNGKEGTFTDGFVILENPNETPKNKAWTCEVTGLQTGTEAVPEETYSNVCVIDTTEPLFLKGNETPLNGLESTESVEDSSKKYIKVRYFKELEDKPEVTQILYAAAWNDLTVGGVKGGEWRVAFKVKNPHPTKYLRNVKVRITTPNGKMVEDTLCNRQDSNGYPYKNNDGTENTVLDMPVPPNTTLGEGITAPYGSAGGAAYIHFAHNVGGTTTYNEHKDMPCPTILKNDISGKWLTIQVLDWEYYEGP